MLENKPEYVASWLGLSKIGVISALINTNIKGQPLLHSIKLVEPKALIYSVSLKENIDTIRKEIDESIQIIIDDFDNNSTFQSTDMNLPDLIREASKIPIIPHERPLLDLLTQ